jgi:putative transposase
MARQGKATEVLKRTLSIAFGSCIPPRTRSIHHAPTLAIRRRIGAEPRRIWNAPRRSTTPRPGWGAAELGRLVASYADAAPDPAAWLEADVPEDGRSPPSPRPRGIARAPAHRRPPIERTVRQGIKPRTAKARVFPSRAPSPRPVAAVLAGIDDEWLATDRRHITRGDRDA